MPSVIEIGLLSLAAAASVGQMWRLRHDIAGDTYIHLTFARNLGEGRGFQYNRGQDSNASTSPLWSLILALLYFLFGPQRVLRAARITAGVFHLLSIFLVFKVVCHFIPATPIPAVAAVLWALNPNAADWAMRAMETVLFIFLFLLSLLFVMRVLDHAGVLDAIGLGVVGGLLILCRPEGWFWNPIVYTYLFSHGIAAKGEEWHAGMLPLALTVGVIAPYYGWMIVRFHSLFPSSIARIFHYRQFAARIRSLYISRTTCHMVFGGIYQALLPLLCIGCVTAAASLGPSVQSAILVLLFGVVIMVFYSFLVPGTDYGGRYILPVLVCAVILSAIGMNVIYERLPPYATAIIGAFILVPIVRRAAAEYWRCRGFMLRYVLGQEEPVRRNMAMWIRDHLPAGITIAAKEIDQIAYYSREGQNILSMDGTIGGEAIPYLKRSDLLGFLLAYRPTHLLVEGNIYSSYPFWQSTPIAKLARLDLKPDDRQTIGEVQFLLAHSEPLFPYVEEGGALDKTPQYWRLFAIDYSFLPP